MAEIVAEAMNSDEQIGTVALWRFVFCLSHLRILNIIVIHMERGEWGMKVSCCYTRIKWVGPAFME